MRTVTLRQNRQQYGFLVVPTVAIYSYTEGAGLSESIKRMSLSEDVKEAIKEDTVGIVPNGRLMFLDKYLRACTAQMQGHDTIPVIDRYFVLPQN